MNLRWMALGLTTVLLQGCLMDFWAEDDFDNDGEVQSELILMPAGTAGKWLVNGKVQQQDPTQLLHLPTGTDASYEIGFAVAEGVRFIGFAVSAEPNLPSETALVPQNPFRVNIGQTFTRVEAMVDEPEPSPETSPSLRGVRGVRMGQEEVVVTRSDGAQFITDGVAWTRLPEPSGAYSTLTRLPSGSLAEWGYIGDTGYWINDLFDDASWFRLGAPSNLPYQYLASWTKEGPSFWTVEGGQVQGWLWSSGAWEHQSAWGVPLGFGGELVQAWRNAGLVDDARNAVWSILRQNDGGYGVLRLDLATRQAQLFSLASLPGFFELLHIDARDGSLLVMRDLWNEDAHRVTYHSLNPVNGVLSEVPWMGVYQIVGSTANQVLMLGPKGFVSWVSGFSQPVLVNQTAIPASLTLVSCEWSGSALFWITPQSLTLSRWDAATGEVTSLELPAE